MTSRGETDLVGGQVLHAPRHLVRVRYEVLLREEAGRAALGAGVAEGGGSVTLEEVTQVAKRSELHDHVQRACWWNEQDTRQYIRAFRLYTSNALTHCISFHRK